MFPLCFDDVAVGSTGGGGPSDSVRAGAPPGVRREGCWLDREYPLAQGCGRTSPLLCSTHLSLLYLTKASCPKSISAQEFSLTQTTCPLLCSPARCLGFQLAQMSSVGKNLRLVDYCQ